MIFEINITIHKPEKIKQQTIIHVRLSEGETLLVVMDKTIDKTISDTFTISIPWTVYGEKGIHKYIIKLDVGNAIEEEDEENNVDNISIEILDNPSSDLPSNDNGGFKPNFRILLIVIIFLGGIIFIFFFILNNNSRIDL